MPQFLTFRQTLSGPRAPHEFPVVRSPSPFGSPFLTCASDAIPFRTYAVAEWTGIHDDKGERPSEQPSRIVPVKRPTTPESSPSGEPVDEKETFQSESARGAINHLKIAGVMGISRQ